MTSRRPAWLAILLYTAACRVDPTPLGEHPTGPCPTGEIDAAGLCFAPDAQIATFDIDALVLHAVDVGGDARADALVLGTRMGVVAGQVFDADAAGVLGVPRDPGVAGCSAYGVVGQLDGDRSYDVLIASCDPLASVYFGLPTGVFAGPVQVDLGILPRSIEIADGDGDGKADLVTLGELAAGGAAISVALGAGNGTFAAPTVTPPLALGFDPSGLVVFRFTPDEPVADLIVRDPAVAGAVAHLPDLGALAPMVLQAGPPPQFLVVADIDGDEDRDVVIGNDSDDTLFVFVGAPGVFVDQRLVELDGTRPTWLEARDLDFDGFDEVLVTDPSQPYVLALRADGLGNLIAAGGLPVEGASVVRAGDVDADGIDDLVVGRLAARELVVWRATSVP